MIKLIHMFIEELICFMTKDIAKGRLCVIHNNVAEASSRLEVIEQKIIAYLVSLIDKDDVDFKLYKIYIKDLIDLFETGSKDVYREVKDSTKNLMKKVMTLKHIDDSPGELQVAWLSSANYKDGKGYVELTFAPQLKPYLLQLKEHFLKFPLEDVVSFKSQYSMPIYLLLKQYVKFGYRVFELEDLKIKLGISEQYPQYGFLKLKVLKVAENEINIKTSLNIYFEEIKDGRKVVALKFFITQKETPKEKKIEEIETSQELPEIEKELNKYINNLKTIQKLIEEHGEERCRKQLDNFKKQNSIKNAGGWLIAAIENDYNSTEDNTKKYNPNCEKCNGTGMIERYISDPNYEGERDLKYPCDCWKR